FGVVLDASYVGTYTSNIRVGVNFDALTSQQIAQCAASAAASTGGTNGLCSQQVRNPFLGSLNGTTSAAASLNTATTVVAWSMMAQFPQFNQTLFSNTEPIGWGDYNSLQTKFNKRFQQGNGMLSRGLSFLGSFTWAKNMVANGVNNNNNGQCPGCVD